MNIERLLECEADFLQRHPEGFHSPEMQAIGKKHKMEQLIDFAQAHFKRSAFLKTDEILTQWIKLVSRSSMVSVFEKPKFKTFIQSLSPREQAELTDALQQQLHGQEAKGFTTLVDLLKTHKLAKWSLISVVPAYYHPTTEVFMKPTTVKKVVQYFELDHLLYKPTPSWEFYQEYRQAINDMKNQVDTQLAPNNAAFSGFLMMTMPEKPTA